MMRMFLSISSTQAKKYFRDALSKADYYIEDQDMNGRFHGKIAERLGLSDKLVTREVFDQLCDNINPDNGAPLTPRNKQERRVGYDVSFHAPKSVSIVHALGKNDQILTVFKACVQDTMQDVEQDMQTRIRLNGENSDRNTKELLWTDFVHQTARPLGDNPPDMHLHCHNFVFNVTYDQIEQRFKAGQFHDLKRDMPYYQAKFQKRLADGLASLGYKIRKTQDGFELALVPQQAIDLFSKRTNHIGQIAKEENITNPKELDQLGARTREKKNSLSMPQLRKAWKDSLRQSGMVGKTKGEKDTTNPSLTAQDSLDHSLDHLFERASVKRDRHVLAEALRHSVDNKLVSFEAIKKAFEDDRRILKVHDGKDRLCTTHAVQFEERDMVQLARDFRDNLKPLLLNPSNRYVEGLNKQQSAAVHHVLSSPDRLIMIKGGAGTGKTTLIKNAVKAIEGCDKRVFLFAPTAQAARDVLRSEGFTKADTISRLLIDAELQEQIKDQVIWIDEAGLLGTKAMLNLLSLTKKLKARIVLSGDPKQHAAVLRGDAMRILNDVARIPYQSVSIIYRQKIAQYKKAVDFISQGKMKLGFDVLDDMGAIKEIDTKEAVDQLSQSYLGAVNDNKTALVVSPTNEQAKEVVKKIRDGLREKRKISDHEHQFTTYRNLYLTQAQKADPRLYHSGQVIQLYQNMKGLKRSSRLEVANVTGCNVLLKDQHGKHHVLDTSRSKDFDVFVPHEIGVSEGDRIRIKKNGFDLKGKRLDNGRELKVIGFEKDGAIKAMSVSSNKKVRYILPLDFGNFDYGYCMTSYASQGKTVDRVLMYQPSATFAASNQKQFYVSVSRGREDITIYTDHKDELLQSVNKDGDRMSVHEMMALPSAKQVIELDQLHALHNDNSNQDNKAKEQPHEPTA